MSCKCWEVVKRIVYERRVIDGTFIRKPYICTCTSIVTNHAQYVRSSPTYAESGMWLKTMLFIPQISPLPSPS